MPAETILPTYSIHARQIDGGRVWDVLFRLNGKQIKRTIGPATKRAPDGAAHDHARALIRDHITASAPTGAGMTFAQLSEQYLRALERKGTRPSTLQDYRYILNGCSLADRPVKRITAGQIEDALDAPTARTFNKRRCVMNGVFAYGVKRAGLAANPVADIEKRREDQRAPLQTFTVAQIEAVAAVCKHGEAVRLAAYTGLRQGELRALRWGDIDFDKNVITVSRSFSGQTLAGTKSNRVRWVPLIPPARAALDRLREREHFTGEDELVVPDSKGQPLNRWRLTERFQTACEKAGLPAVRWHDLRHAFGSLLAQGGVPVTDIMAAMGHSSITTTAIYMHSRQASEQVERFAQAFA